MQTLEKIISDKVSCEVENAATLEARVHDAILSAIDNLVDPKMKLAMRSTDVSATSIPSNVVWDPDRTDFQGDINGPQITACRFNK